ncbi:hypothetical protein [Paraburkholderia humisilvae]|uniref:hypothetical protein n=1 Tax=Paraburkholderia humisilvae TaxID=627669 RepID=UPI00158228EB|nr:hypothetical protein [Paraburkholderia humisilvae]
MSIGSQDWVKERLRASVRELTIGTLNECGVIFGRRLNYFDFSVNPLAKPRAALNYSDADENKSEKKQARDYTGIMKGVMKGTMKGI